MPVGLAPFAELVPLVLILSWQVFIEVNEEGTEAAAVTGIMMTRMMPMPGKPLELRFDRPFVFAVQHRASGAVLFLGGVDMPEPFTGGHAAHAAAGSQPPGYPVA